MTVRRRSWTDPKTGKANEIYMIDVKYRHPDGRTERIRRKSPIQTRRGAERYERELREALAGGTYRRKEDDDGAEEPTFEVFSKEFLETYSAVNNKYSELISKRGIIQNHLGPFFSKMKLSEIGSRHVERFKAKKMTEGLAKKTINNHLAVLRKMLNLAHEWELVSTVPLVKPLKVARPKVDFLSFEELERLDEAARAQGDVVVAVAAKTGLRIGELRGLRWDDVDLVSKVMVVRRNIVHNRVETPKSGRSREVPLCDSVAEALKSHRHLASENVFCDAHGGVAALPTMYRRLHFYCKKAGLRRIGFHTLRHTFASHLVMRGVPLKVVQEMLGHATIEMTMRYAHLSPDVAREYVRVLDGEGHKRGTTTEKPPQTSMFTGA